MTYSLDAHKIAPRLWMGSFPPSDVPLATIGFPSLVLCALEVQERQPGWGAVEIIHAGFDDGVLRADMLRLANVAARAAADRIRNGTRVLVTCAQGLNRSGLVSALALRELLGLPGKLALERVRRYRQVPGVLKNPYFERFLRGLPGKTVIPYEHVLWGASA